MRRGMGREMDNQDAPIASINTLQRRTPNVSRTINASLPTGLNPTGLYPVQNPKNPL